MATHRGGSDYDHTFRPVSLAEPSWCQRCKSFLWGLSEQGERCTHCSTIWCHDCAKPGGSGRSGGARCPAKARDSAASSSSEASGADPRRSGVRRPSGYPDSGLCKFGCGRAVAPGLARSGRPYDTCCRSCAKNPGAGIHDENCRRPADALVAAVCTRPVCSNGSRCRNRDRGHLASEAHPLDDDYATSCLAAGLEPEALTLKVVFDWADADGSGKLSKPELQRALSTITLLRSADPEADGAALSEASWRRLDEDGNGVVNFNEFASWAGPRLGLPLGLKALERRGSKAGAGARCHVLGCPCDHFHGTGAKCKACKHKRSLHLDLSHSLEVDYPGYWRGKEGKFQQFVEVTPQTLVEMQTLMERTYKKAWTRDRKKHNPDQPHVPKGFQVVQAWRNENSLNWQEYFARRMELFAQVKEGRPFEVFDSVKTTVALRDIGGEKAARLDHLLNEWYLFHGTSPDAAKAICRSDFKVSRAGENTGTLYGRGLYFAESICKADEYSKANSSGNYAVLLCRVLGGNVLYTDEPCPDPEELVYNCVEGPFDVVVGDREKCRGTFREFVLYDSEDVYPEYIIEYKRIY